MTLVHAKMQGAPLAFVARECVMLTLYRTSQSPSTGVCGDGWGGSGEGGCESVKAMKERREAA